MARFQPPPPTLTPAPDLSHLSTASPFLSALPAPGAIASYMSPYTSGVVDEIGRLGSRNLVENVIPNINNTFIGSGQFGSDRNAKTIGNAIRDASRDIAGQQSAALQQGYGQAASFSPATRTGRRRSPARPAISARARPVAT